MNRLTDREMDEIIEAFIKVAKNIQPLVIRAVIIQTQQKLVEKNQL